MFFDLAQSFKIVIVKLFKVIFVVKLIFIEIFLIIILKRHCFLLNVLIILSYISLIQPILCLFLGLFSMIIGLFFRRGRFWNEHVWIAFIVISTFT